MPHLDHVSSSPLANLTDIAIIRTTFGAGGDISGRTTQASGLKGYYEPASSQVETDGGLVRAITGTYFIDPFDGDGDAVDVEDGDFVTHTDWRGVATTEREVIAVSPWYDGTTLHHLVVSVGS